MHLLPSVDRGIQLLREGAPVLDPEDLPEVTARNPNIPGYYPEPERLHDFDTLSERFEARPDYFLKMKGDSIDLAGFRSGDVVAVREGGDPRNGDASVELQPVSSNPEHVTIRIDGQSDFEISGIVVGAIIGTRRE